MVHLGPGEERSEDAVMMNTPVIKSALEMGFERSLVKQTVQSKILTSGENYRTVQELVSDLLSAEDQKREEEREMLAEAMASGTADCENLEPVNYTVSFFNHLFPDRGTFWNDLSMMINAFTNSLSSFGSDGFTFVKRHQAALIQRLKSVEPVLEHLREQNVLCMLIHFCILVYSL